MNRAMIIGRIATDLVLRETPTQKNVCEFRLAVNRPATKDGEKIADFINCRVWNKPAENLVKYQTKGSLIAIAGRIQVDNYMDKDGNHRSNQYILVEELEYLGTKKPDQKEQKNDESENDVWQEFGDNLDELPF